MPRAIVQRQSSQPSSPLTGNPAQTLTNGTDQPSTNASRPILTNGVHPALRIVPPPPFIGSAYRPTTHESTQPLTNGTTPPLTNGTSQPLTNGTNRPMANGSTQPLANGTAQPMANGTTQTSANGSLHLSSIVGDLWVEKSLTEYIITHAKALWCSHYPNAQDWSVVHSTARRRQADHTDYYASVLVYLPHSEGRDPWVEAHRSEPMSSVKTALMDLYIRLRWLLGDELTSDSD